LTFHVNRSCQNSGDEGKEKEIENNRNNDNGKGGETPLKNSVKHPVKQNGNENEKDEGTVQQNEKADEK